MKPLVASQSQMNCSPPAERADVARGAGPFITKPLKLLEKPEARNYGSYICGFQINHILSNEYCALSIESH